MTITDPERDTLIKYRIDQAHETVDEVRFLIDNNKLNLAVTRIYYGMFYILCSLALKHRFKTAKHKELIGWFNKTFIKEKKIDRKYGANIHYAFDSRSDSDYGVKRKFEKADVEKMFEDMKAFIAAVEKLIQD
jgi:uncharacterized protein (UPF0332 family)